MDRRLTRWQAFRQTKLYDFTMALPLIAFYVERLWERWPEFTDAISYARNSPELLPILQLIVEIGTYAFVGLVIVMLIVRVPPVARARGIWPRIAAFVGTFGTMAFLALKPVDVSEPVQIACAAVVVAGSALGVYCTFWLGRSFSIMAEARRLRTRGAYALVRHPLYLAEELIVLGAVFQFQQPWAALIGIVQFGFQLWRMHNEEAVLLQTFPEYAAYAAHTSRLIPGIY